MAFYGVPRRRRGVYYLGGQSFSATEHIYGVKKMPNFGGRFVSLAGTTDQLKQPDLPIHQRRMRQGHQAAVTLITCH